ncbi:MAG: class I SAM-dependent methyltransferase [Acidobacteria bacterium]|nr:class I SAM-dependent methyltransferase [Acidobacteriota bacterium]
MSRLRLRDSLRTVATVWQRVFLDALLAPQRFKAAMPEFRRVSDLLFHPGIPTLPLAEIPAGQQPLQIQLQHMAYGVMAPQELCALLRVVRWIEPQRIFEIGTFRGVTTGHLAMNSDAEIYTLDLPRDLAGELNGYSPREAALLQSREAIGEAYRRYDANGRIRQLFGDSRRFDYRPYHGSMGLVIVDGCHLYDYVMSDSCNAFDLLAENSAILWHDFGSSLDVTRAVKQLARRWPIGHLEGTCLAMYVRGTSLALGAEQTESNRSAAAMGSPGGGPC